MNAGFGIADITPRLGVEMSGFGPYLHRVARELREHLYARAFAVEEGAERWVLVSCDLIGVQASTVAETRAFVSKETGLEDRQIMVHCTHTHSGPATLPLVGWGEPDGPYMVRLPRLIANAAVAAVRNLAPAEVSCAEVPAEHISFNRDIEGRPAFADAVREDWQPLHPDKTDRTARVIRVDRDGRTAGFLSSFSCHPVSCCEQTHSIHGDFAGVATNAVMGDVLGSVGLFLQGSLGDINTAFCHYPQDLSMHGLNVLAARYARVIRDGLRQARPISTVPVASALDRVAFTRGPLSREKLLADIETHRAAILADPEGDASQDARMHTVFKIGMETALARYEANAELGGVLDVHALRLGDLMILGTPFEVFRAIKLRIERESGWPRLLVVGPSDDCVGYAVSKERFEASQYGSNMVPFFLGMRPFGPNLEDELVAAGAKVVSRLA